MDMEFATHFPAGVEPSITLWDKFHAPPEGKIDIDAFAFDMLCVGRSMTYFVKTCTFSAVEKNVKWPEKFSGLHKRLLNDLPDRRPSAKEADDVMREVCEDDAAQLSGTLLRGSNSTGAPDADSIRQYEPA
ncbi:hypothetical protein FRC04_008325 [Tulasnella sp. 424]|nr:hypothetical protein FRC04_008325 [Tulasnella sp. 424]